MIYLYWILAVPTGVLASLLILLTLAGQRLTPSTPGWLSVSLASAVLGLLFWGHQMGTNGRPLAAALLVVGSWILFFVVMVAYGLSRQQTWQ